MRASVILSFVIVATILSCKKVQEEFPLKGYWVRLDNVTDTLTFGVDFSDRFLVLRRDFEERNGNTLPKSGSGPYQYRIVNDSIDLLPAWSSAMVYRRFYFKVEGNELVIGDFIDGTKSNLIFRKQ